MKIPKQIITGALVALLILSTLASTACTPKSTTQKLAQYTAQSTAALVALTDVTATLAAAGRTSAAGAKSVYQLVSKMNGAVDVIRDRAEKGFNKQEALTIITGLLDDLKAAQAAGVINLSGDNLAKFNEVIFFAQFTIKSVQAIIQAVKEPPVPAEQVRMALGRRAAAAQDTTWTELVLIIQTAVLRGLTQSRMSAFDAFADGRALSAELKASLAMKLGA